MPTPLRRVRLATCLAALAIACAPGDDNTDSAGGTTAGAPTPATLSLADVAGNWNVRAVPETGTDTAATTYVLHATAETSGWTLTFPGRPALPVRVRVEGDSIVAEVGPYESVRRPGVQVTTTSVSRLQSGQMVGTATGRYTTTGADSVARFRTTATRAP